ncbi:hypothetical protein DPMN_134616 [Dreissena polymorpha]|uniref:Uncharacterized protein n=1 Tax=Dreissena polymorpha TaxID=45954 RepID=A0A9D4G2C7_DREPO|nr:hypothetical protein DPMN_134616 [Dreissena polymorpha]
MFSLYTYREKCPATGGHVFSPIPTIFKFFRDIDKTNKNTPTTGGHVFSPIWTIFELVRDINKTNVLTIFHDDWAKIVTSRVFTRKTALPTGGHVFQLIGTTFELKQVIMKTNILTNFKLGRDFIGTKLLTQFHEDGTRNVASRVFMSKCRTVGRPYNGQRPVTKAHLSNQKDRQTDGRTDGQSDHYMPPFLRNGAYKFGEKEIAIKAVI